MTPSRWIHRRSVGLALLAASLCTTHVARAEDPPAAAAPRAQRQPDNSLERHRLPLDQLIERTIGSASRAVRFDWRNKSWGLGLLGGQLLELNNFSSARFGLLARRPWGNLMTELTLTRVETWSSPSAERLALTPYRQAGRPSRFELGINLGYPVAEGVATARPGFLPAVEIVLSLNLEFRYLFYPGSWGGGTFAENARAVVSPRLSGRELSNLNDDRLPAMEVDRRRYGLLAGFTLDVYFAQGAFVSPRVMAAPSFGSTKLGWWWDVTLAAGWMF